MRNDLYMTICRFAVRDNDLADAATMLTCSIVHKNSGAVRRDGCTVGQACDMKQSLLATTFEIIGITSVPAAYIDYLVYAIKLVREFRPVQGGVQAQPDDIERGVPGHAVQDPFRRA